MKRLQLDIPYRDKLSVQEFHEQYLEPELPVIITDLAASWPATTKWTPEYLAERYGDYPITAFYHPEGQYTAWKRMRVAKTLRDVVTQNDPRMFASALMFVEAAYLIEDIEIPSVVRPEWLEDQAFLWIQPRGQQTGLHWDSYSSMISVIRGQKRVLMFAPDQYERLYPCAVTGSKDFSMGSWSQMDVFAPDFERFPAARDAEYTEVIVNAGETIVIPRHYWHAVENLGTPTIAVSFFIAAQGKPELTFYYDRRLIAGLSIKVGVLTGAINS
jgi:hypothetical protein